MIEVTPSSCYSYVEDLWIITTYFNSCNYQTKLKNMTAFRERIEAAGLNLIIVECAFNEQGFTLRNSSKNTRIVKVKATDVMWQKERLLNIVLSQLPTACKKVAWIDCDILFNNSEWAVEASKLLDVFPVIQLFDFGIELPKDHEIYRGEGKIWQSFASIHQDKPNEIYKKYSRHGHTGFAWAATKDLLLKHKFYDADIAGAGDELMVHAMCGAWYSICVAKKLGKTKYHFNHFINWAEKFYEDVSGQVGCVSGYVLHLWHGDSKDRQHLERRVPLHISNFDPENDISIDENGCWKWNSDKTYMHQWIKEYFLQRKEDGN
ncbi:hypothetical protein [Nostoc sp. FACHB-133]|uniref:hypothetical protein n=1 Tax=Nostoc sp. FACHB-133 TaxID=2692835 RepID=UPI001686BD73|nr:hypothetical protein [Nostoc sp. FACHB-133]MBD2527415.1 hypothetical protein [Nostoc sp. FACHB-133]